MNTLQLKDVFSEPGLTYIYDTAINGMALVSWITLS